MAEADPRLAIGANGPPPRELHALHIEELMEAAQQFLDGQPIETQAQADDVGVLLGKLREAWNGADKQRKVEKKPHDDAAKAVQTAWIPLLSRVETAEQVAKAALKPFLLAKEAFARAEAAKARDAALDAQRAAQDALHAANPADLNAREQAESLVKAASKLDRAASKAEKAKPMAAGMGRAVSLRSVWVATLTDSVAALKFYKQQQPEALREWLREQAQRDVSNGVRAIDGFTISETRVAQ